MIGKNNKVKSTYSMKFWYHIALAALLAVLGGCAKVEVASVPTGQVAFSVGSYRASTKASSLSSDGITSFQSRAFLHATGVAETQEFFSAAGETITYTAPEWLPSHPYYWPKDAGSYVNFVSWHDLGGAPDSSLSETSLSWSERTIAADDNIMFADEAWRFNSNKKVYTSVSGASEGVPTLFHHALARVRFTAIAKQLAATGVNWEVQVTGLSLEGACSTGSLSLVNADPMTEETTVPWTRPGGGSPAWTPKASSRTTLFDETGVWTLQDRSNGGEPVEIIAAQSVLPQAVTDDIVLRIAYSIKTAYSASEYIKENASATVQLNEFVSTIDTWEMNKIITYNIVIDPDTDTIKFDPEMIDWEEVSVGDLVID